MPRRSACCAKRWRSTPARSTPRILLAQKLLAQKQYDEARRELDPLLNTVADRAEVQEMLAEIDVGPRALPGSDRPLRPPRAPHARSRATQRRLEEIKKEWSAANMPSHFRAALDSTALTRADLAVLLYWTVPSIRFAQNLGTPPIAVDIEDVAGPRGDHPRHRPRPATTSIPSRAASARTAHVTAGRLSAPPRARVLATRAAPPARAAVGDPPSKSSPPAA